MEASGCVRDGSLTVEFHMCVSGPSVIYLFPLEVLETANHLPRQRTHSQSAQLRGSRLPLP